ncbi:MAG TPA: BON domain-containing protein [Gammaproteobacteria bacterium]|nr:BON domain-containing protein [Gammaproteobacteria bacterium]
MKRQLTVMALLGAGALIGAQAYARDYTGEAKDAWITGKLEAVYALNSHLDAFSINTDTTNGKVHLTGTVDSDIDRDLAGELAKGIEGVVSVDNDLMVSANARNTAKRSTEAGDARNHSGDHDADARNGRPFGVWVDDATTTAMVKSKLFADPHIKGTKIDVDTRGDVVTLSGTVGSNEQKQLAEQIAKNTGDVKQVKNQLVVGSTG